MLIISSCGNKAKESSEQIKDNKNVDMESTDLIEYSRKWIEINDEGSNIMQNLEVYISEIGDTIYNQKKNFINGKLDPTESNYYELNLNSRSSGEYSGEIIINSSIDYKIESPITQRRLQLYLLNSEDSINTNFESINKNRIKFSYSSSNDTLRGILFDKILIDTIVNGENMVRIHESVYFIDNKSRTVNTFIEEFKVSKN